MNRSYVFHLGIVLTTAAMFLVCGPAAADGKSSGNNRSQPQSAHHGKDDHGKGHHGHGHHHDELMAELAALKERVRKLEGNLKPEELAGTYRMGYIQVAIGENAMNGLANHLEHNVWGGTLTLGSNGTASFSGREVGFAAGLPGPTPREERLKNPDEFTGTWAYTSGAIVITLIGDNGQPDNVTFVGGAGGRMFFTVDANPLDGTTTFIVIVKDHL